jgi:hypothetical protein
MLLWPTKSPEATLKSHSDKLPARRSELHSTLVRLRSSRKTKLLFQYIPVVHVLELAIRQLVGTHEVPAVVVVSLR